MPLRSEMQASLSKAWAIISSHIRSLGFSGVSPAERVFGAIWMLEAEVDNGGFAQYVLNPYGGQASVALEALGKIGAMASLEVLQEFLMLLPGQAAAATLHGRQAQVDQLAKRFGEHRLDQILRNLDERFFATEDDLEVRMYDFAKANGWV